MAFHSKWFAKQNAEWQSILLNHFHATSLSIYVWGAHHWHGHHVGSCFRSIPLPVSLGAPKGLSGRPRMATMSTAPSGWLHGWGRQAVWSHCHRTIWRCFVEHLLLGSSNFCVKFGHLILGFAGEWGLCHVGLVLCSSVFWSLESLQGWLGQTVRSDWKIITMPDGRLWDSSTLNSWSE